MVRIHIVGKHPGDGKDFALALHAIADDIASGGWSGETIVDAWSGRTDIDLGQPIIVNKPRDGAPPTGPDLRALTRYVTWSVTW